MNNWIKTKKMLRKYQQGKICTKFQQVGHNGEKTQWTSIQHNFSETDDKVVVVVGRHVEK